MTFRIIALGFCLLPAWLPQAHAQQDSYPFYAGYAIGFAGSDKDCDFHGYNCDGNDTSFKFYGGKRLHENLAIELSYQDLGRLSDKGSTVTTTAESTGLNLSLHLIMPFDHFGYLYGKAGVMAWETDYTRIDTATTRSSDEGSEFTYGAGFAFTFDERYELRLEFERLNELDDNFTPGGSSITVFSFAGVINF